MDNDEVIYWSENRGHPVYLRGEDWYYTDGVRIQDDPDRPCALCGKPPTPEGYDACLGYLPGVVFACCGHGGEGYIEFENGVKLRFDNLRVTHRGGEESE